MTTGYRSSFRMLLDGEWMAYNQATGDELDMLELSTAPMPAPLFCTRGTHRSDAQARMSASVLNEAKYDDGSM